MNKKINISAIVVGYNESNCLSSCLKSINFCDEILYFDLGSSDNSIEIAEGHNAIIFQHGKVPSCEWIHSKFANNTKHEWVLITDPDEVVDPLLAEEITELFEKGFPEKIGAVLVPWLFYFKHHRLKGTPWGGVNKRVLLAHNKRFSFTSQIHVGRTIKEDFEFMELDLKLSNCVHHYWMQGYRKLLEKHLRYLKNEGAARFSSGIRTTVSQIILQPFRQFKYSFITKGGLNDGYVGLLLSVFWAWYQTLAMLALYNYCRTNLNKPSLSNNLLKANNRRS